MGALYVRISGRARELVEKPEIRSPKSETRSPKPETRNPKPEARSPKPEIPDLPYGCIRLVVLSAESWVLRGWWLCFVVGGMARVGRVWQGLACGGGNGAGKNDSRGGADWQVVVFDGFASFL